LSGRGLCDKLITRPEESYRLWCVVVCDLETSRMRRPWPALGRSATGKKKVYIKENLVFNARRNFVFDIGNTDDRLKNTMHTNIVSRYKHK
jgi:hypothetical protein